MVDNAEPQYPVLVPARNGGKLYSGGVPGPRRGKYLRREAREAATLAFNERIPKLANIADGRVRILLGYSEPWVAAEHFFELRERMMNPEADRVRTWNEAPIEERRLLTEIFAVMLGNGKSMKDLALEVGAGLQLQAMDLLGKYGPGTHQVLTDDEDQPIRGVIALPQMDMSVVQQQQAEARARMGEEADAEYEIIEEEADAHFRTSVDVPPPPVEERVNPELVEIIKRRRRQNGNGKGKEKG